MPVGDDVPDHTDAMRSLPSGTITMLFSDIENSTLAVSRLGTNWGESLSAYRRILRAAFDRLDGFEMGTEGDSFFVVFATAHAALLAALEGQRRLGEYAWPHDVPLRTRMGIHTGEPTRHDDGYIGIDVHRAARISAIAHGGQIVVSETTHQLVSDVQDGSFRDLGMHRLKDLDEPEHLYDLRAAGLLESFPPLRSLGTLANLPTVRTSLVGRGVELKALRAALGEDDVRLVTLTGTGGSGKTRLALAAAASLSDRFPSGIFFVALHSSNRAALMWATIAESVGASGDVDELPEERAMRFLRDRHALLVLDNVEQIPDADLVVSDVLNGAPDIKVLVTSRRPLHLVAEYEYPVLPLGLPASDTEDRRVAKRAKAIELFVRRAQMVQPGFTLMDSNTVDVIRLCRRLDGLPLAIELAAARSRILSPRAMLSRIDDSLGVGVTASDRTERQRTLGKTIAWSYDLLSAPHQKAFRQLGVFSRGFDLAAMEAVVDTSGIAPLDVAARLIDVNLLGVAEGADGEPRMAMLQTIRAFARKQLKLLGERDEMRLRHSRWCLQMATEISETLHRPQHMGALDRMATVQEDIRQALNWCLRPAREVGKEGTELGYQIISQMNVYWHRFGYVAEGRGWQERAVEIADGEDSAGLVDALHGMAVLELQQNDVANATAALEKALEMARRIGDLDREARETSSLGVAHRSIGDTVGARTLFERSIELARQGDNTRLETTALSNLAVVLLDSQDYGAAVDTVRRAIAADRELQDPWGLALNQTNLAMAILRAEGPEAAYRELVSTAPASIALADPELTITVIELLAASLAELGEAGRAAMLMGFADAQRGSIGMPRPRPDQEYCDQSMRMATELITPEDWSKARSRGALFTVEEALTEALSARLA